MAARSRQDPVGSYILVGAVAFVILAGGVLAYAMLRGKPSAKGKEPTPAPSGLPDVQQTTTPQAPIASAPINPILKPPPEQKPILVRLDDLRQQAANDESGTDRKYKDKHLEVTGTISMVLSEPPLIGVFFGSQQDSVPALMCDMDRQQVDISQLRQGQTITVRGIYMGKQQGGFIGLGNCRIIKK